MGKYKELAFVLIASAAISACSSTTGGPREVAGSTPKVDKSVQTLSVYENAKTSYEQWLAKLNNAEPLKLYSRDVYNETMEAWSDAVEIYEQFADDPEKATQDYSLFSSGTYSERFNLELGKVKIKYNKLLELKSRADSILADSIDQMSHLNRLDAGKYYENDFKAIKREYSELFEYVADKDLGDAQNKQAEFIYDAKKLEVKTVLHINISPLEKELKLLKEKGVTRHAPITYAKAKAELSLASNTVKSNPRDDEKIAEAVSKVRFELAHTTNLAATAQRFKATNSNKFETVILEIENQILEISQAVDGSDFRDKPLNEQTKMIVERLQALQEKNDTAPLKKQIAQLQTSLRHAEASIGRSQEELQKAKSKQEVDAERIELLQQQIKLNESQVNTLKQQVAQAQVEKAQAEAEAAKSEAEAVKAEAEADAAKVKAAATAE